MIPVVLRQGWNIFKGKALLDTGLQVMSITPGILKEAHFRTYSHGQSYRVRNADGTYSQNNWEKSANLELEVDGIKANHQVAILTAPGNKIVIGMDWMAKFKPYLQLQGQRVALIQPEIVVAMQTRHKSNRKKPW